MDEDRNSGRYYRDIWRTWKIAAMKAEPEALFVKESTNDHFRSSVFRANALHYSPTLTPGACVSHFFSTYGFEYRILTEKVAVKQTEKRPVVGCIFATKAKEIHRSL